MDGENSGSGAARHFEVSTDMCALSLRAVILERKESQYRTILRATEFTQPIDPVQRVHLVPMGRRSATAAVFGPSDCSQESFSLEPTHPTLGGMSSWLHVRRLELWIGRQHSVIRRHDGIASCPARGQYQTSSSSQQHAVSDEPLPRCIPLERSTLLQIAPSKCLPTESRSPTLYLAR